MSKDGSEEYTIIVLKKDYMGIWMNTIFASTDEITWTQSSMYLSVELLKISLYAKNNRLLVSVV